MIGTWQWLIIGVLAASIFGTTLVRRTFKTAKELKKGIETFNKD